VAKAAALKEAQERVTKAEEEVEAAVQATLRAEGTAKKEAEEQVAKAEAEMGAANAQLAQEAQHPKALVPTAP
jgi:hypothetical protein